MPVDEFGYGAYGSWYYGGLEATYSSCIPGDGTYGTGYYGCGIYGTGPDSSPATLVDNLSFDILVVATR